MGKHLRICSSCFAIKTLAVVTDNASNNVTFVQSLSLFLGQLGVRFRPEDNHIRCFAHIANLVVRAALVALDELTGEDDNDSDVDEEHPRPVPQRMGALEKVSLACSVLRQS